MASKPDGKPSGQRVTFTKSAADRIAATVRTVEAGGRDCGPMNFPGRDSGKQKPVFRAGTYDTSWAINGQATVTFLNQTATPNTVSATNLFVDLPSQGKRECAIAKSGTAWYLVQTKFTSVTVITSASLGTAGLTFTRTVVHTPVTATVVSISIGTTAC